MENGQSKSIYITKMAIKTLQINIKISGFLILQTSPQLY